MNYPFDCVTDFIFADDTPTLSRCEAVLVPGESHTQLIRRAAQLYRDGMAKHIIVSGGYNPRIPEYRSEAEFLKVAAMEEGIPSEAVICEEKAANTYENALFSCQIMRDRGIGIQDVILVCKAFHSRRALFTYQKEFPSDTRFTVIPVTDYRGITRDNWFTREDYIKVVMGEVEKMGRYFAGDILPMYLDRNPMEDQNVFHTENKQQ